MKTHELASVMGIEPLYLSPLQRIQIADILEGRANEVASYQSANRTGLPHAVEVGLTREISRYRKLAAAVKPPKPEEHEEFEDDSD